MLAISLQNFQNNAGAGEKDYFYLAFGFTLLFCGLFITLRYIGNYPKIVVDSFQISFNKQVYYWKDIKRIELTGLQPFNCGFTWQKYGACLTFKDGRVKYFYDALYANTHHIKWFIHQSIINKRIPVAPPVSIIDFDELEQQQFEEFKRSQFLSIQGLLMWFMLFMFTAPLIQGSGFKAKLVVLAIALLFFYLLSYGMNYFCLSEKYLVIKNNNFFWQKKVYHLKEIREVDLESLGKGQMGVRIQTKDFRNNLYPATLLTDKQLGLLLKALRLKGVPVSGY